MKKILGDRHQLFAFFSVLTMFLGTCVLWWFVLVGGNPYHPGELHFYDQNGTESYHFKRGDWVVVRRHICLDRDILAEQSPALFDLSRKALVPLIGSAVIATRGCAVRSSMFQIPDALPPGPYEYRNISRFQNNLVGRDEANSYPPMKIEVLP